VRVHRHVGLLRSWLARHHVPKPPRSSSTLPGGARSTQSVLLRIQHAIRISTHSLPSASPRLAGRRCHFGQRHPCRETSADHRRIQRRESQLRRHSRGESVAKRFSLVVGRWTVPGSCATLQRGAGWAVAGCRFDRDGAVSSHVANCCIAPAVRESTRRGLRGAPSPCCFRRNAAAAGARRPTIGTVVDGRNASLAEPTMGAAGSRHRHIGPDQSSDAVGRPRRQSRCWNRTAPATRWPDARVAAMRGRRQR
jgi:hypothetical protein